MNAPEKKRIFDSREKNYSYKRLVTTKNGKSEKTTCENVCSIQEECGKCSLVNIDYKEQLVYKTKTAKEAICSLGANFNDVSVKDCVPAPKKYGYRHFVHLMISEHNPTSFRDAEKRRIDIGFYQPKLKKVIDIGRCPILNISLNHVLAWLRTGIRVHKVSIQTSAKKNGLLHSVILNLNPNSKQIFICFLVTKLNSSEIRSLACDIAAKFSDVSGIFMKLYDDTENKNLKILTGRLCAVDKISPNIPAMEKILNRIKEIKSYHGIKNSVSVISTNDFISKTIECEILENVLTEKTKIVCFVSSLSQEAKKMLKILSEHNYNPLFVEPFDVLPGTDYFENITLLERSNE